MVKRCILLVFLVLAIGSSGVALGAGPLDPAPKERCGTCGMYVAPYADRWLAQIQFKDGSTVFFDGPKDMFIFFFDLAKHRPGAKVEDIREMYVTEYHTSRKMKIGEVFLVSGSDVLGPMGQELVPVAGREQAETFYRDHGGKKLTQFNGLDLIEVTPAQ